ncbi:hypothetical protein CVD28_03280 [Bacillus sp. M6-12]|uniref:hypothetical protein n=1 Tax=Bacillus sp. M6-12 TaxID=2054166 RepID=UPI000C759E72|nr:hypothetical protein [Bacillus sp. M6-12]PLS19452.1 hypothetical protein CVD28_03280 [Bacillus sp. M6-12]
MEKKFIWSIGDASMEFSNGSMQYFKELEPAKDIEDVLYFYYDVLIKIGRRRLKLSTYDFPKVQNLHLFIQEMINHKTKEEGYLLEDFQDGGFSRKIRYHQLELEDTFWIEYFVRLEKYCYEVKQWDEETPNEFTTYKMTIGEIGNRSNGESCVAWFINDLSEEKLLELAQIAQDFVQYSIEQNNIQVEEWIKEAEEEKQRGDKENEETE